MADRQAYEQAANDLLPTLYKIAYGILRSDADARDAVQQALLKAWEKRDTARQDAFRGFLTRILINECRNIQRQRMRVCPADLTQVAIYDESPDYRDLYKALNDLPEALRLAVMLKYLHDYSEKEAARALRIPVTTYKSRLHRARSLLRKQLSQGVIFE